MASHVARILAMPSVPQRTPAWYAWRDGRVTATLAGPILSNPAFRVSAFAGNRHTERGNKFESVARDLFAAGNVGFGAPCTVAELGGIEHPLYPLFGASSDGLITSGPQTGNLLEIKCPETLKAPSAAWKTQCWFQLAVTGAPCVLLLQCVFREGTDLEGQTFVARNLKDGWLLHNARLDVMYPNPDWFAAGVPKWEAWLARGCPLH